MSVLAAATAARRPPWGRTLLALLLTTLAFRCYLLFRININWDEFHYLSFVYDYLRPSPLALRQTFHVHLFSWLPALLPADEVAQILVARVLVFAVSLGASGLIYVIGRRFLSSAAALFAVLSYHSVSEVIQHGASFRPDPLAALLVLAAIGSVLAGRRPLPGIAAAGLIAALSLMLTLKTLFFLPTLAILVLAGRPEPLSVRSGMARLAVLAASFSLVAVILGALHGLAIETPPGGGTSAGLGGLVRGLLWTGHWFPGRYYLTRSLQMNALVWILLGAGIALALGGLRELRAVDGKKALALLALSAPLATFVFYRNAFPYYYGLVLAPAIVLCGLLFDRSRSVTRPGWAASTLSLALILGVFVTGLTHSLRTNPDRQSHQRELVRVIHQMFPEPVPYIDHCSMIAGFPKVGFFMSSWGMDRYRRARRPVLSEVVAAQAPPLLLANNWALNLLLPDEAAARLGYPLLAQDRQTLRDNYVHHWGIIFVAGKEIAVEGGVETEFSILIPGAYSLEGDIALRIDGRAIEPGQVLELAPGRHTVTAPVDSRALLRWGDRLYRPQTDPSHLPVFDRL